MVVSSHHALFFNVLCNELKNERKQVLPESRRIAEAASTLLQTTGDTPFFHHVAALAELYEAARDRAGCTRTTSTCCAASWRRPPAFIGYDNFSACIKRDDDDADGRLYTRVINLLSHGNYSLYEPQEMVEENKELLPEDPATSSSTVIRSTRRLFPSEPATATKHAHDRTRSKTTRQDPLEHRRPAARGDERGRLPRLHAVVPVPALPLGQLRAGGEEGTGARLP